MPLTEEEISERARELRDELLRSAHDLKPAEPHPDDESAEGISLVELLTASISSQLKVEARVEELEREVAAMKASPD